MTIAFDKGLLIVFDIFSLLLLTLSKNLG